VFLLLSLLIGAITGFAVVAFIVLTERLGMRFYPVGFVKRHNMLHCTPAMAAGVAETFWS